MPLLTPDEVDPYPLLTSLVVPRPIAWVSSVSAEGVGNLAPHSFFSVACAHPPVLSFTSVGAKDTLANVLATGEFTVSVATERLHEQVNASSAPYPPEIDEASALGVAMAPSHLVAPPRVAGSPAAMECRLHSTHALGDSTLVLGDVVAFWVDDDVLVDGLPAIEHLRPVSRLGRNQWGRPPEVFAVDRPRRPSPPPG